MNFCPRCGTRMITQYSGGRDRPTCPTVGCGFIHFGSYSIGCGAVVLKDNKVLLVQRGIEPNRGAWQIPGGYVESDEGILAAVEREVLEESGIVSTVNDIVGVRHAIGTPTANIYVVFRLDPVSGVPTFDGDETTGAGYFSQEDISGMEQVQGLSVWSYQQALNSQNGAGLTLDQSPMSLSRRGWSLFVLTELYAG